jgi:hypothetical protein
MIWSANHFTVKIDIENFTTTLVRENRSSLLQGSLNR